jgi:hypothetical protein
MQVCRSSRFGVICERPPSADEHFPFIDASFAQPVPRVKRNPQVGRRGSWVGFGLHIRWDSGVNFRVTTTAINNERNKQVPTIDTRHPEPSARHRTPRRALQRPCNSRPLPSDLRPPTSAPCSPLPAPQQFWLTPFEETSVRAPLTLHAQSLEWIRATGARPPLVER